MLKFEIVKIIKNSSNIKNQGDKFRLMIAHTLREDGYQDDNEWNPLESVGSRADAFEYVMYGKIYRIDGDDGIGDASRL